MTDWNQILTSILLIPLFSAGIIMLLFRQNGRAAVFTSVTAALAIMLLSLQVILKCDSFPLVVSQDWLSLGSLTIQLGFFMNDTAAMMLFVVSFVGFWIHVFSVGYMHNDKAKSRYFGGLSIFMFSMLGIVLADNLIMIFIFWELVGFSSYMLIAHYWNTEESREACKKAFIMNRVGDFGMLIGIIWAFWHYGTVNLQELSTAIGTGTAELNGCIALLLMCGFIGKSAQFPLHTWLPDAMAGPTPVSALIHAATMVAAGIYFLCRIFFMFDADGLTVIMWLGTAMAVYAGFCAFAQRDIKKILAYSTLSQLGYMATAVGLGYPGLALFHTATHAFFKALLFLGSGSVIHACHHEQDIFKMGGLYKRMPVTTVLFGIGTAALCGVMYLSGFYSKDAIIEAAYLTGNTEVFYLIMFGAFLTSLYMGRLYWIAFFGKAKSDNASHAKESNLWMVLPLLVLAVLSVIGGVATLWPETMSTYFSSSLDQVHKEIEEAGKTQMFLILGNAAWIVGFILSYIFYKPGAKEDNLKKSLASVYGLLKSKLFFDEIYGWYVEKVQQRVAEVINFIDAIFIGGLAVRGAAGLVGVAGLIAKSLHSANVQNYILWFFIGTALFWAFATGVL